MCAFRVPEIVNFAAAWEPNSKCRQIEAPDAKNAALGTAIGTEICPSVDFLISFGMSRRTLIRAQQVAQQNGTLAGQELIAFNGIEETIYYRLLAIWLDVPFVEASQITALKLLCADPGLIVNKTRFARGTVNSDQTKNILAPDMRQISQVEKMCQNNALRSKIVITAPSMLRQAVLAVISGELILKTQNHLQLTEPYFTAKRGGCAWQGPRALCSSCLSR